MATRLLGCTANGSPDAQAGAGQIKTVHGDVLRKRLAKVKNQLRHQRLRFNEGTYLGDARLLSLKFPEQRNAQIVVFLVAVNLALPHIHLPVHHPHLPLAGAQQNQESQQNTDGGTVNEKRSAHHLDVRQTSSITKVRMPMRHLDFDDLIFFLQ